MKCKNCGTDFSEGIFCPECGAKHIKPEQTLQEELERKAIQEETALREKDREKERTAKEREVALKLDQSFCPHCENHLENKTKFCPHCGKEIVIQDVNEKNKFIEESKNNQRNIHTQDKLPTYINMNGTKDNSIYNEKIPVILSIPVILLFGLFTCGLAIPIMGIIRLAKYPGIKMVGSILTTVLGGTWVVGWAGIIILALFFSTESPEAENLYENIKDVVAEEEPIEVEETKDVVEVVAQPTATPKPTPEYDLNTKDGYLTSMGMKDIPEEFQDYFYYLAKAINDKTGLSSLEAIRKELGNLISDDPWSMTPEETFYQYASMSNLLEAFEDMLAEEIGEKTTVDLVLEIYDAYGFKATFYDNLFAGEYVDPSTLYVASLEDGDVTNFGSYNSAEEVYNAIAEAMSSRAVVANLDCHNAPDFVRNQSNVGSLVTINGCVSMTSSPILITQDPNEGYPYSQFGFFVDTSLLQNTFYLRYDIVTLYAVFIGYDNSNEPIFAAFD